MVYVTGKAQHPAWKFLKFLLLAGLLLGAIAGYLYFNPDLWQGYVKGTPLEAPPSVTKTYKWRDENGEWHISDRPPKGDVEYETRTYSSDVNIVPSVEVPEEDN